MLRTKNIFAAAQAIQADIADQMMT